MINADTHPITTSPKGNNSPLFDIVSHPLQTFVLSENIRLFVLIYLLDQSRQSFFLAAGVAAATLVKTFLCEAYCQRFFPSSSFSIFVTPWSTLHCLEY